jgi:membrane fusion protein, multidrug efflux system
VETNAPTLLNRIFDNTSVGDFWHRTPLEIHILIVIGLAFVVHLAVKIVRHISEWSINKSQAEKNPFGFVTQQPKFITLTRLIVSAITFVIYFLAIGFVLVEGFKVNLTTYLASASIIGLAVSFGSQSLVQDLVTGVTLIFSNAMDVGDIVDLSGTIGRVERIGLRFTKLKLFAGAAMSIVLVAIIFYYLRCVAPYESTDDAFIDGYVTLISPRVPGQVARLMITDNQEVKAGDVLLEIDSRDYETSLSQAKADLAAASSQANQSRAQVNVSEAKVAQAQAAVTAAEAENQRATDDLKRYENVESRAVSKSAFDLVQAQARAAAANLEAACSQTNAAESDVELSEAGVETAKAAVQQAEAKLQQAKLNLSYTKIIAPFDGRVTARTVQLGNYVQPGQALMALVPRDVWVVANFKETQLTYMKPGQPVELRVDAYPNKKFKGKVDSLQAGTGARFSLLPPENAVGNYIKVVQRVPVKIIFDEELPTNLDIAPGMSVVPIVKVK